MKQLTIFLTAFVIAVGVSRRSSASDLIEVLPVTDQILMLQFDDGYIQQHGYHQSGDADVTYNWPLNLTDALNLKSYTVISTDDADYANGLQPLKIGRKSKGHDFSKKCLRWTEEPWADAACKNDYISWHFIYLQLPFPLENGKTYTINVGGLADNVNTWTFTYDLKKTRSVAIHTNQFGYIPDAKKYAYLSQWMGNFGIFDVDAYNGKRFDIYPINPDGTPGASVFNGTISKQKDLETGGPDNSRTNESPYANFVVSDVWQCDFSALTAAGEYILSVEGFGCSYPFRIANDVYYEPFYYATRSLYYERALTALPEQFAGPWAHDAWEADIVYTKVRTLDLSDESGANQKQNIFDNFDRTVDLSNMRGWYHDAGDWDGYFSHFEVPRHLLMTYELVPDNFKDGELNIPESQSLNGFSNTHIPDILDEAVWLVDYFKNNIGPTGGIFGSRIDPDISDKSCRISGIPSWEDCAEWIVHGEDPRDSYAFAAVAAQYAYCLGIAATKTLENYSAIADGYATAAANAYAWAAANTKTGDESKKDFVESRMAASVWLYKLTGTVAFLNQFKADLTTKNINQNTTDLKSSQWAVYAYVLIDGTKPLYSGTFDSQLKTDLTTALQNYAAKRVTTSIDNNRSMRMGGDWTQPVWNGQATTPWIMPAMVAYKATGTQSYLDACRYTCDYFLGGNQLNFVWMTNVGHEHPKQILHHDSEYHPDEPGYIPGVPPYGPRTICDWFAPAAPHPFAGNSCYYNNSHDADFALRDGRIYPDYYNASNNPQWPLHELYFDNYGSPPTNEFTVHQNNAPAAAAYAFLTAANANTAKNQAPEITIMSDKASYTQGEIVTITPTATDDTRLYKILYYQNNMLIMKDEGAQPGSTPVNWKALSSGTIVLTAVAIDSYGERTVSEPVQITVNAAQNLPAIELLNPQNAGYYRNNTPMTLQTAVSGQNIKVEFFNYGQKIGEAVSAPYTLQWTPDEPGDYKIRAVATDDRGLSAHDEAGFTVTPNCMLIAQPTHNEAIEAGGTVIVKAQPDNCGSAISKVVFHIGTQTIEDPTAAPDGSYDVSFQPAGGAYTIYALGYNDEQVVVISDSVTISVGYDGVNQSYANSTPVSVYPNPFSGKLSFSFSLAEEADIRIAVYDLYGRQVAVVSQEHFARGEHSLDWQSAGVSPGVYYYEFSSVRGEQQHVGRGKIICTQR